MTTLNTYLPAERLDDAAALIYAIYAICNICGGCNIPKLSKASHFDADFVNEVLTMLEAYGIIIASENYLIWNDTVPATELELV